MSNITALLFEDTHGADDMFLNLETWQEQGLVTLLDAVVAIRKKGSDVELHQKIKSSGKYTAAGGGIGFIAGMILGGPIGGLAVGAAAGAIGGHMKRQDIDKSFIDGVVEGIRPNTSVLFVMTEDGDQEGLEAELRPHKAQVLTTTLSGEQESNLRELLKREE